MTMAGAVSAKFDDAVICVSGFGGPYIGGSYTGVTPKKRTFIPLGELGSDVQVQICHIRRQHATEYDGFTLEVLVAPTNESTGFGIRYEPDVAHMDLGRLLVAQTYKILVSFLVLAPTDTHLRILSHAEKSLLVCKPMPGIAGKYQLLVTHDLNCNSAHTE
ncbi:hypothetical protein GE09DRAFT_180410 [Coniochaeta sp. 2T2.1]|nr:hypothetical protein GE09DRAFT_180410 [Coniochaeta sp. 2T2.1]